MADVRISDLPLATLPLAGTEFVPLVQGGATKRTAASTLTNGFNFYRCNPVSLVTANTWYTVATVAVAGAPAHTVLRLVIDAVGNDGTGAAVSRKLEIFASRFTSLSFGIIWQQINIQSVTTGSVFLELTLVDGGDQGDTFLVQARRTSGSAAAFTVAPTIQWVSADVDYDTYTVTIT